jgi:hypothetical protein
LDAGVDVDVDVGVDADVKEGVDMTCCVHSRHQKLCPIWLKRNLKASTLAYLGNKRASCKLSPTRRIQNTRLRTGNQEHGQTKDSAVEGRLVAGAGHEEEPEVGAEEGASKEITK